jgi:hypothetical protein
MPIAKWHEIYTLTIEPYTTWLLIIPILISDYASLFVVRPCLLLKHRHPVGSLILAAFSGITLTLAVLFLFEASLTSFGHFPGARSIWAESLWRELVVYSLAACYFPSALVGIILPAFVVQLWLPLFVAAGFATRGLQFTLKAINFAQWFLRTGSKKPFEAIGIVAAIIVFLGGVVLTYVF